MPVSSLRTCLRALTPSHTRSFVYMCLGFDSSGCWTSLNLTILSLQSQNPSGQMSKRTLLYPWAEAATVGTSRLILRGGDDWGVGFAAGRRGRAQQKTQSFYQRLAGHAPSARYRCVSTTKGIVLPSSISFKWEGGLWCMKRGWGCC